MAVVHHPAADTVIALIDALPDGGVIATDCDGTVWNGDIGDDVVRAAANDPKHFGGPPVDVNAYEARLEVDYEGACLSACGMLRHVSAAEAKIALKAEVPASFAPRRYFTDALRDAMDRGVQVWFVSASPLLAVEVGAELIGFEPTGKIGIELTADGYRSPWPIDAGKPAAWRARDLPPVDLAFGDSQWDLPLLQSASTGVMLIKAHEDTDVNTTAAAIRARR